VNYRNWKNEWDAMQSKYFSLRAQEREVQTGLQEEMTIRGQLDDVIRKLKILEQSDHAEILQDYQLRQKQEKVINIWEQEWGNLGGSIRDLTNNIIPSEIDFSSYSSDSQEAVELADMVEQVRYAFQLIREEMQSIAERIDGIRNTWLGARPSLMITSKIYAAHQTYTDLMGQLSGASINDPSSYGELVKQRQSLEEKLESISKKKEMLSEYRRNASECLNSIREHRAKLTVLRNVFLESVLSGNHYVQISVTPYGDKESVEDEFRRLIDRSNGGFDRDIGSADSDEGILAPLYQATDETRQDQIDNVKSRIVAIRNNEDATISLMKDRRFASHIQGIEPEKLDRLDCWFPQDSLSVRYSLKNGDNFRPVEQGSPGQKTAALLAFILSYGDEPLILDQPEDDLDNQLIYDLIVTQLREIKQRRQVLVVTHNANIVVNGDAENVVVLDVRAGQTRIAQQGGLQDQAIRDEICRVMEGGKDAFNQRYRRINAGQ
jgi:DNA repair exonuclease SbcCD ATPase subunit